MKYETYVEYRNKMHIKDIDVSRMCGIPKSTFSGWKNGKFTLKIEKQLKIANVLKIPQRFILEPDVTKEERYRRYLDSK